MPPRIWSTLRVWTACALALPLLAACGAAQVGTYAPTPLWSDNLVEAVPSDATAAVIVRLHDELDAETAQAVLRAGLAQLGSSAIVEDIGIAHDGGVAAYVEGLSAVFLTPLADSDRFNTFLNDLGRTTGWTWEKRIVGQAVVMATQPPGGGRIDAGVQGNMGFIRVAAVETDAIAADAALRSLLTGHATRGTLMQGDVGQHLLSPGAETPIRSLAWMRTQLLDDLARFLLGGGLTVSESCEVAAEGILTEVPWMGIATFLAPGDEASTVRAMVRVQDGRETQLLSLMPPTDTELLEALPNAPLVMTGRISLLPLVDLLTLDPSLTGCTNIAGILAQVGNLRRVAGRGLERDLREYSGQGAFVLQNFEVAGFAPLIEAAVMAGHAQPPLVLQRIQTLLRRAGSQGRVVEDAAITTIEHRVLAYRLQLMQTEDRFVVASGGLPHAGLSRMATGTPPSQGPFMALRWDGESTRPMIEAAVGFLAVWQGWDEPRRDALLQMLTPLMAFHMLEMTGEVTPSGPRLEGTLR